MKIVLVRHGFSEGNLNNTYSGWSDVRVTPQGIEELRDYMQRYHYPKTDRYYSSSLTRCLQTFEVLFGEHEALYEVSDAFREIYFGIYENKTHDDVPEVFFTRWFDNERVAEGELLSEFCFRIQFKLHQVLADLQDAGLDSATIVCHGGVIKGYLMLLQGLPFSKFRTIDTPNGLGYVLDLDYNKDTQLLYLNDVAPIQEKK